MINLVFGLVLFFMALVYPQNTGLQPSFMLSTFTIVLSIWPRHALLLNITKK
jgi:hypothetical protein